MPQTSTLSGFLSLDSREVPANAIAVTVALYAAGNVMGGLLTFPNALRPATLSGTLMSLKMRDKVSARSDTRVLYLFSANPTSSTFTDKAAPSIHVNDLDKLIGRYEFDAPKSELGTMSFYGKSGIGAVISAPATTLYGVLVTLGAPSPGSTSDIALSLGMARD